MGPADDGRGDEGMSENPRIDVQAIMAEIKEEVAKKGSVKGLPDFNDIPIMEPRMKEWAVSCVYPAMGNPLKKTYTKIISKIVRAALFPVTERMTEVNLEVKKCTDDMAGMIEVQREEIDKLTKRIEELEKTAAAEKKDGEE